MQLRKKCRKCGKSYTFGDGEFCSPKCREAKRSAEKFVGGVLTPLLGGLATLFFKNKKGDQ